MAQARATDRTQPKPVEVRDTAIWHFRNGKVAEILTLQDQFAILKQIGYVPECVPAA
jgi:ketosteroid isomerase-like protein